MSAEISRYGNLGKFLRIKTGIGLQAAFLNYQVDGPLAFTNSAATSDGNDLFSPNLYFANVKLGFIEDIGRKVQLQACPTLFCAINSAYGSDYFVSQRPYGLGLECLLVYRLK
jgi:hypothetical protein